MLLVPDWEPTICGLSRNPHSPELVWVSLCHCTLRFLSLADRRGTWRGLCFCTTSFFELLQPFCQLPTIWPFSSGGFPSTRRLQICWQQSYSQWDHIFPPFWCWMWSLAEASTRICMVLLIEHTGHDVFDGNAAKALVMSLSVNIPDLVTSSWHWLYRTYDAVFYRLILKEICDQCFMIQNWTSRAKCLWQ